MIQIQGNKYAKNDSEFINSLFEAGNTCDGFYTRTSNGIKLYNMQRELFAFIVNNKHDEQFFVSARKQPSGQIFYNYALSTESEKVLGLHGLKYSEQLAIARQLTKGK